MAVLTDEEKNAAARRFGHRIFTELGGTATITFVQLVSAIGAIDSWIEANAVSYNQAIPADVRAILSASQKAELLAWVARKKTGEN